MIITKTGRPCAVLMPVTEDTDLEILALSQSKRFWAAYDRALRRAKKKAGRRSMTCSLTLSSSGRRMEGNR